MLLFLAAPCSPAARGAAMFDLSRLSACPDDTFQSVPSSRKHHSFSSSAWQEKVGGFFSV